jgi:hypothetical protein
MRLAGSQVNATSAEAVGENGGAPHRVVPTPAPPEQGGHHTDARMQALHAYRLWGLNDEPAG